MDVGAGGCCAVYLALQHGSHCVLPTAVRARKNPFGCRKGSTQSPTATSVCSVSVAVRSKRVWLYGLVAHRPAVGGIDCNASVAEGGPQSTARSTARGPLLPAGRGRWFRPSGPGSSRWSPSILFGSGISISILIRLGEKNC